MPNAIPKIADVGIFLYTLRHISLLLRCLTGVFTSAIDTVDPSNMHTRRPFQSHFGSAIPGDRGNPNEFVGGLADLPECVAIRRYGYCFRWRASSPISS